jgi:type I phosphodiesterase/nucleotide pyrophosphatase
VTSRRTRLSLVIALVLVGSIALISSAAPAALGRSGGDERAIAAAACDLPHQFLLRTWRGWRADRGPEIQMIAEEPNYVGSGLPHVGPWEYVQHVPMFWYGPGHIAPAGEVSRPVTSAGIAPTQAALLDTPFTPADGQVMREVLGSKGESSSPPRLIVTLVWDAAGINVLEEHPNDWPFLKSLIEEGTWYSDATVGSSPTSTAQIHTTIGTGAFPRNSGLIGHRLRIGNAITTPWSLGPAFIDTPTLADVYDRVNGNDPIVGLMGTVAIHAGMLGHGAMWGGGDKDIALFRQALEGKTLTDEAFEWNLPGGLSSYYEFLPYTNDVPGFEAMVDRLDKADGKADDKWRDNSIPPLLKGFDTPARVPYQEAVIEEVIRREGFGADQVGDLLFINHKIIDFISHVQTMNSPEMRDAVAAEDAALETFVRFLDQQVGEGEWALLVTADHGAIPDPDLSGALQISTTSIAGGINAGFDTDGDDVSIVDLVQPTGIFVDEAELKQNGHTLSEVARFVFDITGSQAVAPGVSPGERANDRVFSAVFPSEMMSELPCLPEART